jgi:epoxyqueuosine reductase QueG
MLDNATQWDYIERVDVRESSPGDATMLVTERTTLGPKVPAILRTCHGTRIGCDDCRKVCPADSEPAVSSDGSDWTHQFNRLVLRDQYKFIQVIDGSYLKDLCPECAAKRRKSVA